MLHFADNPILSFCIDLKALFRIITPITRRATREASFSPKRFNGNLTSLIIMSELGHNLTWIHTTLYKSVWFHICLVCIQCEYWSLCQLLSWLKFTQYFSSGCQCIRYKSHILIKSNLDHQCQLKKALQGPNIYLIVLWGQDALGWRRGKWHSQMPNSHESLTIQDHNLKFVGSITWDHGAVPVIAKIYKKQFNRL